MVSSNPIVENYSNFAREYDHVLNVNSCWGKLTNETLSSIQLKDEYRTIVDIGCGTGQALTYFSSRDEKNIELVGVDPAHNMIQQAQKNLIEISNARVVQGSFEDIPLENHSVDYLFSNLAFHWTTNVDKSIEEIERVLKPDGDMDIFFVGRNNGKEFQPKLSAIYLKYLGPQQLLQSAKLRTQLTVDEAKHAFEKLFGSRKLSICEQYHTFHDTLEGHWGWWRRTEGHFLNLSQEQRENCDQEIKSKLMELNTAQGIPYTIHLIHVKLRH